MSQIDLLSGEGPGSQPNAFQLTTREETIDATVTQDYDLIHAIQRLDLRPKRLLLSAISKVNPLLDFEPSTDVPPSITVTASDWAAHWGVSKRDAYRDLKSAAEGLVGKRFWINNDLHQQEWRHWVSGATYQNDKACVLVELDRKLMPFVCGAMAVFSSYKLDCVQNLKSVKSHRLYEMLNQFAKSGVRQIELDELREAIDTTDKATRWSDFNRWVLRGLVNDINEHSNLEVHYRPIKKGRSVTTIRFTILVKRDWTPPSSRLSTQ